jgi:HEAT repeat protein
MILADAATTALAVLVVAAAVLGTVIVLGRAMRRARDARRTRLAAPARRLLLAVSTGDDDADVDALVVLPPRIWRAIEPNAVALLGKVRGEAYAALVSVFERRGAGTRALRDVRRRDPVRRGRAAEVLGSLRRDEAVPALVDLLGDPDPDVRIVAARALGTIGDPSAAPHLLASVAARRSIPSHQIAHAVVRIGAPAQPAVVYALGHQVDSVRAVAAEVLGLIGAVGAARRVEEALRDDPSVEVRVRAARTLGRLGTRGAVAPLLAGLDPGEPPALRAEAARALGELGTAVSTTALAALLGDAQYQVAHEAARSLLRLGAAGREALNAALGTDEMSAAHAREALALAELDERRRSPATAALS